MQKRSPTHGSFEPHTSGRTGAGGGVRCLKDWIEDDFDFNVVDTDVLANALTALAKSWPRKSPAKRARRA
jgi:hypothetical protein